MRFYNRIKLPRIIAHRGARNIAPENTLAAMRAAKAEGAEWVEFDVMLTRDGEAVVVHDNNVKRTTNGKGEVGLLNYQQIAGLDAGSWFSPIFKEERIPRLLDMIACLSDLELGANIEIKPYPGHERATAVTVLQLVKQHWPDHLPTPLFSSFSLESLHALREHDSQVPLGLLLHHWRHDCLALASELECESIHLNHLITTLKRVKAIKDHGYYILCYTVNRVSRAQRLFSWGVDAVFSDCPGLLLAVL